MDPSTGRFVTRDTWLRSRARPPYLVGNPLPTGLNPHVPTTDASGRTIDGAFHVESVVLDGFRELQTSTSLTVQRVYSDLRFAPKCIVVEVGDVPQGYRGGHVRQHVLELPSPSLFRMSYPSAILSTSARELAKSSTAGSWHTNSVTLGITSLIELRGTPTRTSRARMVRTLRRMRNARIPIVGAIW